MVNFKKIFEGVPGGAPPRDHHQWKEEKISYKRVPSVGKVYDFPPYLWPRQPDKILGYGPVRRLPEDHNSALPSSRPMSDSEQDELVFLSPDSSPEKQETADQGASPVLGLRRSTRKRKSTSAVVGMTKGSSSKKKKSSPKTKTPQATAATMPKVPRSPSSQQPPPQPQAEGRQSAQKQQPQQPQEPSIQQLLLAMEARLTGKIEKTSEAVKEAISLAKKANDAIEILKVKVNDNEAFLREAIEGVENRLLDKIGGEVKGMVREELKTAGFDPDLTAGQLTEIATGGNSTYASILTRTPANKAISRLEERLSKAPLTKQQRQEEKFDECRRSLRLWPIPAPKEENVVKFLEEKLLMDKTAVAEDVGEFTVKPCRDVRSKQKDEVIVTFENKQVRDMVKLKASNLANFREEAGMRLHVPDFLQKVFHCLMNLAFDLKKKNKDLKRNIKFDDNTTGLFMDIQFKTDGPWKRVRPEQAVRVAAGSSRSSSRVDEMAADELTFLLAEDE